MLLAFLEALYRLWFMMELCLHNLWYRVCGPEVDQDEEDVRGKVIVMTECTSEVGKALAEKLASRGAKVILGCRDMEAGKAAQEDIMYEAKSKNVGLYRLDLNDLASTVSFAREIGSKFPEIHFLINKIDENETEEEESLVSSPNDMKSNYFGLYLLTRLLLPQIRNGAPSRIICVTSTTSLIFSSCTNVEDLASTVQDGQSSYCHQNKSKLALSLFAKELGRRMDDLGVTSYSVCPGLCASPISPSLQKSISGVEKVLLKILLKVVGLSPDKAAESILYCVLSRHCENETGRFYRFEKTYSNGNKRLKTDAAKRLWESTETWVKPYLSKSDLNLLSTV